MTRAPQNMKMAPMPMSGKLRLRKLRPRRGKLRLRLCGKLRPHTLLLLYLRVELLSALQQLWEDIFHLACGVRSPPHAPRPA